MRSNASPARSWTRLGGVDLLRGLAIFFVLMNHVNMRLLFAAVPYTRGLPHQLVDALVWNGQQGVQIFFTVSGFLITSTALRRWRSLSNISVRDFYLLRLARIGPLLALLLVVLGILHLAHVNNFVVSTKTGGLGRAIVAALTFHVNLLEATRGYLPANWDILWSLSVEEMFYLFFPLLCRITGGGLRLTILLLAFTALGPFGRTLLAHGNPVWQEYSYLGGMDAIALGCITALVVSRGHLSPASLRVCEILGSLLLLFTLGFSKQVERLGLERTGLSMTLVALGTCLLIAVAAQTQWQSWRLLDPLARLGQRSYEVYLTHMFVVFACFGIFVRIGKPLAAVPPLFLIVLLLSGLMGNIVAKFYSEPINRTLRRRWAEDPGTLGSVVDVAAVRTVDPL